MRALWGISGLLLLALLGLWARGSSVGVPRPGFTLKLHEILGPHRDGKFAEVLQARRFAFPKDHGAHRDFRTEWWYLTGNLEAEDGRPFGFQLTFFRQAASSSPAAAGGPVDTPVSSWRTGHFYMAHFTIADLRSDKFYCSERFSREALDMAGCATGDEGFSRVWTEDWSFSQQTEDRFRLEAEDSGRRLSLELRAEKAPVLQGHDGLSQKGPAPGEASYYYSLPRLTCRGQLGLGQQDLRVTGRAWLDREWSSRSLPPQLEGWDWFCLQMDDNTEVMFYRLRRPDGQATAESAGSLVDTQGRSWPLSHKDVTVTPVRHWMSPIDKTRYPLEWKIELSSPRRISYLVRPRMDNQELNLAVRYWEGAIAVTEGQTKGVGFLELVGYGPKSAEPGPARSDRVTD